MKEYLGGSCFLCQRTGFFLRISAKHDLRGCVILKISHKSFLQTARLLFFCQFLFPNHAFVGRPFDRIAELYHKNPFHNIDKMNFHSIK